MDDAGSGVLAYGLLLAGIGAATFLAARSARIAAAAAALARRTTVLPAAPARPAARSIEQLAADLRRLRSEVEHPRAGVTMTRQRGIVWAYDDNLVRACRALGIATSIRSLPDGLDREAERSRVEFALQAAGLSW